MMILLAVAYTLFCAAVSAEYRLPPLPFDPSATEPVISAQANKFHHDYHHAGYVSNTNKLLEEEGDQKLKSYTLSELVAKVGSDKLGLKESKEQKLRNFGGGAWNHAFWWRILAPYDSKETKVHSLASGGGTQLGRNKMSVKGLTNCESKPKFHVLLRASLFAPFTAQVGQISDDLTEAIENKWGSVDGMIDEMKTKANELFGSGWAWLIIKEDKLAIVTTPNQDNPLMSLVPEEKRGVPIFGIDVWEHTYYLTYGPMKARFTEDIWRIVNWDQVSKNYQAAKKGKVEDLIGKEFNDYKSPA